MWQQSLDGAFDGDGYGSRDIYAAPDGSVVVAYGGRNEIHRFFDRNGDGDFMDADEHWLVYSAAAAVGDVTPTQYFAVAAGLAAS